MRDLKENNNFKILSTCPLCNSSQLIKYFEVPYRCLKQKKSLNYSCIGVEKETILSLNRCGGCDFIFTNPRLKNESMPLIYNEGKDTQHNTSPKYLIGTPENMIFNRFGRIKALSYLLPAFSIVNQKLPLSLFDYGCGYGNLLSLAREFGIVSKGIEVDEFRLSYCKSIGLDVYTPQEYKKSYDSETFDLITAQSVFEHIVDLSDFRTFIDLISKKGSFFIVDGLTPHIIEKEKKVNKFVKAHFLEHINYCNASTLDSFMGKVGFKPYKYKIILINGRQISLPLYIDDLFRKFQKPNVFLRIYVKE